MSNVYEYHFNPNERFGTYCYSPQTRQEKKAGRLFLIGQAKKEILDAIANEIERGFYSADSSTEDPFQVGLNLANNFIAQNPDQSLGIVFGALCLQHPYNVKLSKIGDVKMLLLRGADVFDMGRGLQDGSASFPNFIEGALQKKDKILLLTKEVFDVFIKEKLLEELSGLKTKKEIKRFFKEKKSVLKELSGCLIISIVKKTPWPLFAKKEKLGRADLPQTGKGRPSLPPAGKAERAIISFLLLIILLLLGYLIF